MPNFIEVFDAIEVDSISGKALWTGVTGTRAALQRDGFMIAPNAPAHCPAKWLDERGYLDAKLARRHSRPWSL
ncbi:hypothetical protein [Bradyrhizobium frederickii]|uniref:hypothetical protein n=1 Tax=Bradyrhizobium frederickii TaxID=2560054 RepID=UPI001430B892|nr:hypothetical protein [Bradyrhizobium frederickii]